MEANIDTRFRRVNLNEFSLARIHCLVHFHSPSHLTNG